MGPSGTLTFQTLPEPEVLNALPIAALPVLDHDVFKIDYVIHRRLPCDYLVASHQLSVVPALC